MSPQARVVVSGGGGSGYTLIYHSEYGTVPSSTTIGSLNHSYNTADQQHYILLSSSYLPEMTCDGRKFLGWYLDPAFTIKVVSDNNTNITSIYNSTDTTLNLYAKWQETIYVIEGETLTGLANAVRAKTGVSGSMSPKKIGETFAAWEVEDKSAEIVDGSVTILDNSNISFTNNYAFAYCTNLTHVNLPICTHISSYVFLDCVNLVSVSLPSCTRLDYYAFSNCTKLESVYLAGSQICSLPYVQTFYNTPMSNSGYIGKFGSIYVPASLVASYKATTNWVTYSNRITSIV